MAEYRFNVFGTQVAVTGEKGGWRAFYLGAEGKRRSADFVVPSNTEAHELAEYLADLFHENATPRNPVVRRLSHSPG
jgi:hypothetical protein